MTITGFFITLILFIIGLVLGSFIGVLGTIFCTDMLYEGHKQLILKKLKAIRKDEIE
jgi:hypothetical protein